MKTPAVDAAEYRRACNRIAELQDGNDRLLAVQTELRERIAELERERDTEATKARCGERAVSASQERIAELVRLARCTVYAHYLALLQREAGDHSDGPRLMVESHLDALGELAGISTEKLRDIYKDAPLLRDLLRTALEDRAE